MKKKAEIVGTSTEDHRVSARGYMKRITGGDSRALEALYDLYSPHIYSYILGMMRQREVAEELLQDAFITVWKKAAGYSAEKGSVLSWILRVTRNKCIDEVRRSRRRPETTDGGDFSLTIDEGQSGPEELAVKSWEKEELQRCLEELAEAERRCLDQSFFNGLSHAEISELLDYPLGSVKTYIRRGMKNLADCLKKPGGDASGRAEIS